VSLVDWIIRHLEQVFFLVVVVGGILAPLFRARRTSQPQAAQRAPQPMDQDTLEGNLRRMLREGRDERAPEPVRREPERPPAAKKPAERARPREPGEAKPRPARRRSPPPPPTPATAVESGQPSREDSTAGLVTAAVPPVPSSPAGTSSVRARAIQVALRRGGLREGILLKEILDPPVGERMPRELMF
jgi:hypothetical protein